MSKPSLSASGDGRSQTSQPLLESRGWIRSFFLSVNGNRGEGAKRDSSKEEWLYDLFKE